MTENVHQSVLLNEAIEGLKIEKGDVFLDATLGGGGHSAEVAKRFGDQVEIVGLDLDPSAIDRAKEALGSFDTKVTYHLANFRELDKVLEKTGHQNVNKILFDLGLSSNELESSGKGFSFKTDEPLLMNFGEVKEGSITAEDVVNRWQEENIADILYGYGGERFSRRIAKAIIQARRIAPIKTTFQLVKIIEEAVPSWYRKQKLHFATKTFQALRITANDELNALKDGLEKGWEKLAPEGRMAVISFHSLEDRIVKQFFNKKKKEEIAIIISKKPIVPERTEIMANPRSRSAKLRLIEKIK
jgi:16S rRNA (cytosine1402-N4)-methyltransferase